MPRLRGAPADRDPGASRAIAIHATARTRRSAARRTRRRRRLGCAPSSPRSCIEAFPDEPGSASSRRCRVDRCRRLYCRRGRVRSRGHPQVRLQCRGDLQRRLHLRFHAIAIPPLPRSVPSLSGRIRQAFGLEHQEAVSTARVSPWRPRRRVARSAPSLCRWLSLRRLAREPALSCRRPRLPRRALPRSARRCATEVRTPHGTNRIASIRATSSKKMRRR